MSTHRYDVTVIRVTTWPDGTQVIDEMALMKDAPGYEVGPALKALAKKVHESPPPVVLEGQESMI